jgi:hypothetical protein
MNDKEKAKWFELAVKFMLAKDIYLVMKSRAKGDAQWAIIDKKNSKVLNSNLEWEDEIPLDKRDEAFKIRTRFSFELASGLYEQYKMFAV